MASQQPYRQLRRSRTDSVIGGVCGGLGRFFGLDPVILRIAFAVAIVIFGTGFLLYLILWAVVPLEDDSQLPPRPQDEWTDF